jgi:hypothetical protein
MQISLNSNFPSKSLKVRRFAGQTIIRWRNLLIVLGLALALRGMSTTTSSPTERPACTSGGSHSGVKNGGGGVIHVAS